MERVGSSGTYPRASDGAQSIQVKTPSENETPRPSGGQRVRIVAGSTLPSLTG